MLETPRSPSVIRLTEYTSEPDVYLTRAQRDAVLKCGKIGIAPSAGAENRYTLTPSQWVGVVDLGDLQLAVSPRFGIERLLFLMSYALDPRAWTQDLTKGTRVDDALEAMGALFIAVLTRTLRQGLLQGYQSRDEALLTVRGRIRMVDQLRSRYGATPPIEVSYDEFTDDIEENRLIKAALRRLTMSKIRSRRLVTSLLSFSPAFERVLDVEYDARRLPQVRYNRLSEKYRPAVELATLILESVSLEFAQGEAIATAFLVDMNKVFENFAVVALREALSVGEREFTQGGQDARLFLDVPSGDDSHRRIRLRPDISWWEGGDCVFVGDLKYKYVNDAGVRHGDLYQLLAYAVAADLPAGLLIYAAGEAPSIRHRVVHLEKVLEVTTLDVSGEPTAVLAEVQRVAIRIRQLRRKPPI